MVFVKFFVRVNYFGGKNVSPVIHHILTLVTLFLLFDLR